MTLGHAFSEAEIKAIKYKGFKHDASLARSYLMEHPPLAHVVSESPCDRMSLKDIVARNAKMYASSRPIRKVKPVTALAFDQRSDQQNLRKIAVNSFILDEWVARKLHLRVKSGKAHVLLLDHTTMHSSRTCQAFAAVQPDRIIVANNNTRVCAEMREQKHALVYQGTLRSLLDELPADGDARFSLVFYDGMATLSGNKTISPLKDLRLLFRKRLLDACSIVAITLCTRGAKGGMKLAVADTVLLFTQMAKLYGFQFELLSVRSYVGAMLLLTVYVEYM